MADHLKRLPALVQAEADVAPFLGEHRVWRRPAARGSSLSFDYASRERGPYEITVKASPREVSVSGTLGSYGFGCLEADAEAALRWFLDLCDDPVGLEDSALSFIGWGAGDIRIWEPELAEAWLDAALATHPGAYPELREAIAQGKLSYRTETVFYAGVDNHEGPTLPPSTIFKPFSPVFLRLVVITSRAVSEFLESALV